MLKSNERKALENLEKYIRDYTEEYLIDGYDIDPETIKTRSGLYKAIYTTFIEEMKPRSPYNSRRPEESVFYDWAQGLAMGGLFCYYYNREAAKDVAAILEETAEDVAKYKNRYKNEDKAEEFLTHIIYREISKEARKTV